MSGTMNNSQFPIQNEEHFEALVEEQDEEAQVEEALIEEAQDETQNETQDETQDEAQVEEAQVEEAQDDEQDDEYETTDNSDDNSEDYSDDNSEDDVSNELSEDEYEEYSETESETESETDSIEETYNFDEDGNKDEEYSNAELLVIKNPNGSKSKNRYKISYTENIFNKTIIKEQCCICLDDSNELIKTPCNHLYHKKCLQQWFINRNNCPTCRSYFNKKIKLVTWSSNICNPLENCSQIKLDNLTTLEITCLEDKPKTEFLITNSNLESIKLQNITIYNNEIKSKSINIKYSIINDYIFSGKQIKIIYSKLKNIKIISGYEELVINSKLCDNTIENILNSISINTKKLFIEDEYEKYKLFRSNKKVMWQLNPLVLKNLTSLKLSFNTLVFISPKDMVQLDLSNTLIDTLELKNLVMKEYPSLPKNLNNLFLSKTTLEVKEHYDLSEYKNLETIFIINNKIKSITLPILLQKTYCNIVKLENCALECIHQMPTNIRELYLIRNKMDNKCFNLDLLEHFDNLSYLNISNNNYEKIPKLPLTLRDFTADYNKLKSIDLSYLNKLYSLSVTNNKITSIKYPQSVIRLNVSSNRLEEIVFRKKVKNFDVSNNLITNILISKKIKDIEDFNCSNNRLTYLDLYGIKIITLICSKNNIGKLKNYYNVCGINLSHNPISKLKLSFKLNNYSEINVKKTNITKIDFDEEFIKINKFKYDKHKLINKVILLEKKDGDIINKFYNLYDEKILNIKVCN